MQKDATMLVNGELGNLIGIHDRGLLYGDGVFRTLRLRHAQPLHWSWHYAKLQHDCAALNLVCPAASLLLSELQALGAQQPEAIAKIVMTRGSAARGYAPPLTVTPTRILSLSPVPQYPEHYASRGVRMRVCQLRLASQPRLAGIKHLNRLENVLAAAEDSNAEYAEGLLLDHDGNVIEGICSNLFLVRHGALLTPDLSRCGVAGVQRERVLHWAKQQGVDCQIQDLSLSDVLAADEVFLLNSVIGLWPVSQLNSRSWAHHPLSLTIQKYLNDAID